MFLLCNIVNVETQKVKIESSKKVSEIVIIGADLAGLSTAYHLKNIIGFTKKTKT